MGLFGKIFGGDPERELEKARALLDAGRPDKAVHAAKKLAERTDDAEIEAKAEAILGEAREALLQNALGMVENAEESEFYEDAIEWLDRALEQVSDAERRTELEARRAELAAHIEDEDAEEEAPRWRTVADTVDEEEEDEPFDESGFDAWLHMLDDEVAAGYRRHLDPLRSAYTALVEERTEDALEILDALVEEHPDVAVLRFERGRALLVAASDADSAERAINDLDAAWSGLGDDPLDRAGGLSAPALWAEANLLAGRAEVVVERLEELGDPSADRLDCALPWARALVEAEAFDDAETVLQRGMRRFQNPEIPHLLAQVLSRRERQDEAIVVLETAIAPSCATGNCAKPPAHVPSFRSLALLHLSQGEDADLERVADLLGHIERAQRGLASEDLLIAAGLYRLQGDEEAAAEAMEQAEALRDVVVREKVQAAPKGAQSRIL